MYAHEMLPAVHPVQTHPVAIKSLAPSKRMVPATF
jgi:hypothetical protein